MAPRPSKLNLSDVACGMYNVQILQNDQLLHLEKVTKNE
jgi:hypothetical protein